MKNCFFYFVICLTLLNCKESKPELTYQYSDQPVVIDCDPNYSKLLNEALYNFEANLLQNSDEENPNLINAYRKYLKQSERYQIKYNEIADEHAIAIFEELNQIEGLFVLHNNELQPNYNHEIYKCIAENISEEDTKTTFKALLSTNSMSMRMVKDVLYAKSYRLVKDKYLAIFIALDLFYAKLYNVTPTEKKSTSPIDTKVKAEKDPHAGHNHD